MEEMISEKKLRLLGSSGSSKTFQAKGEGISKSSEVRRRKQVAEAREERGFSFQDKVDTEKPLVVK